MPAEKIDPMGTPPKSVWEKVREWAAFVLSVLAFGVSLLTAYYTTLRQVDDLRVVVVSEPDVRQTPTQSVSL
jgi:hypothetical protein